MKIKNIKCYLLAITILTISNFKGFSQKTKLKIGDKIPMFELYNQYGNMINSYDYVDKNKLVLFFYPEDDSELSIAQFCLVRDYKKKFDEYDVVVLGINPESVVSHKRFVIKNRIPISLLFDRDNKVQKIFGIPNQKKSKKPSRYTFIINKKGIIANIFFNEKDVQFHIDQALVALNKLIN